MTARQSAEGDRLLCEAEDLLSRLYAARLAASGDTQRIAKVRRVSVKAIARMRRRLTTWVQQEARP